MANREIRIKGFIKIYPNEGEVWNRMECGRCARLVDVRLDRFDYSCKSRVFLHFLFDGLYRVHDRGMVAVSESHSDAFEAERRELLHEEHGDLARMGDFLCAASRFEELVFGNVEFLGDGVDDRFDSDATLDVWNDVRDDLPRERNADVLLEKARLHR